MAPEDIEPEHFEKIQQQEAEMKEKERLIKLADQEIARRLSFEMEEEALIQKAIAESLKDIDHQPSKEVNLSSKLNVDCAEFVFSKPGQSKKKGKGYNQQQKKFYVVKGQQS